jgi:hypothetical protein
MLVLGAVAALLATGLWMYALIDVLLTPPADCRSLPKGGWLAIAGLLLVPGALAWLAFGRPSPPAGWYRPGTPGRPAWRPRRWHDPVGLDAEAALRRHPAGRARQDWTETFFAELTEGPHQEPEPLWPVGPDDDPEFLRYLDRVIRDIREAGNEA